MTYAFTLGGMSMDDARRLPLSVARSMIDPLLRTNNTVREWVSSQLKASMEGEGWFDDGYTPIGDAGDWRPISVVVAELKSEKEHGRKPDNED